MKRQIQLMCLLQTLMIMLHLGQNPVRLFHLLLRMKLLLHLYLLWLPLLEDKPLASTRNAEECRAENTEGLMQGDTINQKSV